MQRPRGPAVRIDIRVLGQRLDQTDLVVGVENGEVRAEPRHLRVAPQDACRKRVKGADPETVHGIRRSARRPGRASRAPALLVKVTARIWLGQACPRHRDMREPRRQYPGLTPCRLRPARGAVPSVASTASRLLVVEGVEIGRARDGSDQVSGHGPSYQPGRPGCGRFAAGRAALPGTAFLPIYQERAAERSCRHDPKTRSVFSPECRGLRPVLRAGRGGGCGGGAPIRPESAGRRGGAGKQRFPPRRAPRPRSGRRARAAAS